MKYEISKGKYPVVSIVLEKNEIIITKHKNSTINWISDGITKNVINTGKKLKFLIRNVLFGNDKIFDVYEAQEENQFIAFSTSNHNNIKAINIKKNEPVIIGKGSLIAMSGQCEISDYLKIGLFKSLFWETNIAMQKISGEGVAFIEINQASMEYLLNKNQSISTKNGHVAAMDGSCRLEIIQINIFRSLFNSIKRYQYKVTGPGKVTISNSR
jgi:uncharacterized protein (AIM24 family)